MCSDHPNTRNLPLTFPHLPSIDFLGPSWICGVLSWKALHFILLIIVIVIGSFSTKSYALGFFLLLNKKNIVFEVVKEREIEIGYPTDVKHVAHIGWDGPSGNAPTWVC